MHPVLPDQRIPVTGMRPEDLLPVAAAEGVDLRLDEARRMMAHRIGFGHASLATMKRAPRRHVREWFAARCAVPRLEVVERIEDPVDGSLRYLFRHPDGKLTEAVRIGLHKPGHFTVCLSSQVGCAMKCAFCATGRLGLSRNLAAWEIVSAWLTVRDEAPGRVTGAVFMGQGEPFHNYEAVIRAAQVLCEPNCGRIAAKAISISTVGLVPRIRQFTAEGHPFRLIVSMTSADPERRRSLLPVAGKWSLEELADALRARHAATGRRLTVAWVLMGGVNTGADEPRKLKALLGDLPVRINLIDVNDDRPSGFVRATDAERDAFFDELQVLGAPIVRRYSVGSDQSSACGMLAARHTPAPGASP